MCLGGEKGAKNGAEMCKIQWCFLNLSLQILVTSFFNWGLFNFYWGVVKIGFLLI